MSFEEVLEYLFLDNMAQWHYEWYPDGKYYNPKPREDINTKKINNRIKELQKKFLTPYYVIDNTEKSE